MVQGDLATFGFFDDFVDLLDGRWQVHQAGGVGGSAALVNAEDEILGGILQLAVSGNNNHKIDFKLIDGNSGASFKITKDSGKKLWYATKVRMLQVADLAMYVGLFNPAECAFGHTLILDDSGLPDLTDDGFQDGIYFRILTATPTEIDFGVAKDKTETEVKEDIIANAAAFLILGFFFDGVNTVTPMINGVPLPDHKILIDEVANFPDDVALLPHFSILTGEDVIKSLKADWIKVTQER